jgi:hypothetical protein
MSEATAPKDEASEPTDSNKDDSNKDIDADKKDSTADSGDVASDTEDSKEGSTDSEPADTSDDTSSEDTSTVADDGGNDDSLEGIQPEEGAKDREKKLSIYRSLRDIRASFNGTADIYDTILSTDIPESNIPTIKIIRKKIGENITLMDELLSDTSIAKTKTYADLQVIHNIYLNDLQTINKNLKAFYNLIKPKK